MSEEPPKIIYIMGTARSGSTILEILLAKGKNIFGAGEITSLIEDGFVDDKQCSCQKLSSNCEVWASVKKELRLEGIEYNDAIKLQKKVDWHGGFIRQLFGRISTEERTEYQDLNQRLFRAIKRTTDKTIVLDSSKYAGRAIALNRIAKVNISVICLTRSPAGLMSSFQKPNKYEQKPKTPFKTLIYYIVTLASVRIACWMLGSKVIKIRYEDLLKNPSDCLQLIEKFCEIDLSEPKKRIVEDKPFDVGHIVTGNRLRKQSQVYFQKNNKNEPERYIKNHFYVSIMNIWQWGLRF